MAELSDVFEPLVEKAGPLPVDSHELVARVAPRGLLVLDNPHLRPSRRRRRTRPCSRSRRSMRGSAR